MLESFTRDGEPERWPNPEKEMRRKKFGDSVDLEQKRFLLPTNPEAKALLDKLREAVNFLKENHQEVIGFSLHGSLVKGYATEKSDKRYELYPKSIKEARNYFVGNGM